MVDESVRSEVLMKHPVILILPSLSDGPIGSSCLLALVFHTSNRRWKERLLAGARRFFRQAGASAHPGGAFGTSADWDFGL